ncbi:hypothetical protein MTR67_001282 [Solanum verrucosum]|uniref:Uncharacterized protein n=1 Tax=Solanum verrucosum TaxID=315347 RepID=A0AAF0T4Y3_SOLVR|nr:hypothetical protein MTR67_001282 [Solanum verrucosum]
MVNLSLKQNQLEGSIPMSLLDKQFLRFLLLSRNNLNGQIASMICNLKTLQVLDLGSNNLDSLIVTTKGLVVELPRVLTTNIIIDLSTNSFEGHIPSIIGDLVGLRTLNLSHNRLEGCIPKGKQFDTVENSSYQGNDGLCGFSLSKDCGGDDGVAQMTTLVELDQEERGDSSMISWQAVLTGYGYGLFIGLSIIYIVLSTQYPAWFSRIDVTLEHKIIKRMKRHKKRY